MMRSKTPSPIVLHAAATGIRVGAVRRSAAGLCALLALAAIWFSGCGPEEASFRLNLEGRDPAKIRPVQNEAVRDALQKLFGTPDKPLAPDDSGLDLALLEPASGPIGGDAQGRQTGLYRRYCAVCHGTSGDGAGPTASMLTPYPRDFRSGVFKYTSTASGAKPTRDDLTGVLLRGVPGTAMPSHIQLRSEEINALVEYVRYLSVRGQVETYLLQLVVDEDAYLPLSMKEILEEGVAPIAQQWAQAPSLAVTPPPPPKTDTAELWAASVARGRELYVTKDAQCVKCHGPEGAGDGEDSELYDDWNKPKKGLTAERTAELARLYTLPLQKVRPRNFREGVFRGGSRPEDLYLRICVGIKGTPMPAAGPAPGARGVLTPDDIWHVVHYVLSLSRE